MNTANTAKAEGSLYFVLYITCLPLANWMLRHVGTCGDNGPCVVPVWPGIMAPSGVLAIGSALVLRDLVQRRMGLRFSLMAIAIGAVISWFFSPAFLVVASVAAFIFSETTDALVFTPLQKKGLIAAVILSSIAGIVVDSVLFLSLAFHSLNFLGGQIIGKLWAVVAALPIIWLLRQRDTKLGVQAA